MKTFWKKFHCIVVILWLVENLSKQLPRCYKVSFVCKKFLNKPESIWEIIFSNDIFYHLVQWIRIRLDYLHRDICNAMVSSKLRIENGMAEGIYLIYLSSLQVLYLASGALCSVNEYRNANSLQD